MVLVNHDPQAGCAATVAEEGLKGGALEGRVDVNKSLAKVVEVINIRAKGSK